MSSKEVRHLREEGSATPTTTTTTTKAPVQKADLGTTTAQAEDGAPPQGHPMVTEVVAVASERGTMVSSDVFVRDTDGHTRPGTLPAWLEQLTDAGFDRDTFNHR